MALLLRPKRPCCDSIRILNTQLRTFSISVTHTAESKSSRIEVPKYPYGAAQWYKQSDSGLYGGLRLSSGNNVSKKTETKTRRKWRPNIVRKRIWSEALNKFVRVRVATRVLRTIDKSGGLDNYLTGEKPARIKELGLKGWELRCRLMETQWWARKKLQLRQEWGLSPIRKYYPEELEQEEGQTKVFAMYGEEMMPAVGDQTNPVAEGGEAAEAAVDDGEEEYDLAEGSPEEYLEEAEKQKDAEEETDQAPEISEWEQGGIREPTPVYTFVSERLRRRAIMDTVRARRRALREKDKKRWAKKKGITLNEEKPLNATRLRDHIKFEKERNLALPAEAIPSSGEAKQAL